MRRKRKTQQGVKYPEAVTADGNKVLAFIIGQNPDMWVGQKFYTPGCEGSYEDEMQFMHRIHRKGVTYFFRHKAKAVEDRKVQDRYLHNSAEVRLAERFNNSEKTGEFWVKYYVRGGCPKYELCPFKKYINCQYAPKPIEKKLNLRSLYDTCTLEKGEDRYIADLLLTNSKDKSVRPLFLEIFVTHECSDKKKNSGNRIIELTIKNLDDANNDIIQNSGPIFDDFLFLNPDNAPKIPPIKFYGFEETEPPTSFPQLGNFTLKDEDGIYCGSCRLQECNKVDNEISENTAISISAPLDELNDIDLYELGMAFAYKQGVPLRDCSLCAKYKIPYGNTDRYDASSCRLLNATYHQNEPNRDEIKIKDPYVFQLPYKCEGFDKSKMARDCRGFIFDTKRIDELNKVIRKLHGVTIIL
jgi:hypothetical protein